jgi:hypothetical protein
MLVSKYSDTTVFRLGVRGGMSAADENLPEDQKPGVQYRRLFRGDPERPGNFEMVVLRSPLSDASIHFPRHRHDFDQVRLTLAGRPAWAPKREVPPGSIVYTAAGTFYGPYDRMADEVQLHVQFEGANHAPFLDYDTVAAARREMSKTGHFERGIYVITEDGSKKKLDAHQAVMEFITGRPMTYPASRYKDSIQMDPAVFEAEPVAAGVQVKRLGTFTERSTSLSIADVADGATFRIPSADQTQLLFVMAGTGVAEGQALEPFDGLKVDAGEGGAVAGGEGLRLFILALPRLKAAELAEVA